ncbi:hypothetical protein ACFXP3_13300 [Streptomyces sp. NPDC059096]|uniref:hypothetical protein n=1 Tax=Streptomyces sp. NPDC059096 TaxID=3346727 RepID=UPI0036CFB943
MKTMRVAPRAAALVAAGPLIATLVSCSSNIPTDAVPSGSPSPSRTDSIPVTGDAGGGIDRPIAERDVVGVWNNHQDTELHQQIRFTRDHEWHEDQHGTRNIYHGTWGITGKRTVLLHEWDEEIRFSPYNYNEFTVVSFDHVLTKDKDADPAAAR